MNSSSIVAVGFLGEGKQLLTATATGVMSIHNLSEKRVIHQVKMADGLKCVSLCPTQRTLAAGSDNGTLRILSYPELATKVTVAKAHTGPITAIAFSPYGSLVASTGADRRIVLWNGSAAQQLYALRNKTPVNDLAFSADGSRLATCSKEEVITVWNLALVRPQLAIVGLDWDLPSRLVPTSTWEAPQPPPAVKTTRLELAPAKAGKTAPRVDASNILAALYRDGRYQEVITAGAKEIAAAPENKEPYLYLARAHFHLGNYAEGAVAAQGHLARCPNCIVALDRWAACEVGRGAND
jgi:hypothetical protein